MLGQGSFGKVVKCTRKVDRKVFAVKLITNIFDGVQSLKQLVREVNILRKLSGMKSNIFTTNLHDVILIQD